MWKVTSNVLLRPKDRAVAYFIHCLDQDLKYKVKEKKKEVGQDNIIALEEFVKNEIERNDPISICKI